jgi:DNA-binding MarR family transcriptional regulator
MDGATGDPAGAIFFWLQQAQLAMRREILARFQEQGEPLTPEQWTILLALWSRDGRSQAELARTTGRDRPGVTRLVDTLERRGLVVREPSPEDRRRYRVVLTPEGRSLHHLLFPVVDDVMARALAGIPEAERQAARRILRRIRENLSRNPPRPTPDEGDGSIR